MILTSSFGFEVPISVRLICEIATSAQLGCARTDESDVIFCRILTDVIGITYCSRCMLVRLSSSVAEDKSSRCGSTRGTKLVLCHRAQF
jgi:hypothetical protein